ncbi:dynein axonemal heavy chain 8-like [Antedon mediterranea]|uniref:dynein axonemal heavy chain 8-like n=1 Tax=Antedon mediterranea TaxID=105859 RepID=UPI003AF49A27
MYIFGKFEAFCKRCEKIIDVVNTIEVFSVLATTSIEGIDPIANKFQVIYSNIKKKPYEILDHRKIDFDVDYDEFKKSIYDLEYMLQGFLDSCFSKITSSVQALVLLRRFERLNIPHLNIEAKYAVILHHFGTELETIRKLYQKNKEDPLVPRDMPPVSGKISWARQLFRRIQQPMDVIKTEANVMKTPEAKRIIRNYNRMASVLMEFELLYHRAWVKQVDVVKIGLQASLLVRHPETNVLLVNFDPMLLQVIREAECMRKLDLEVPTAANVLCLSQEKLRKNCETLKTLKEENDSLRAKIPTIFQAVMAPHLKKVDLIMQPGLAVLTWTSLNIETYFHSIRKALKDLALLVKEVNDIREARIDSLLDEMGSMILCDLPSDKPWTVEEFCSRNQKLCESSAAELYKMSMRIEDSVTELINVFIDKAHKAGFGECYNRSTPDQVEEPVDEEGASGSDSDSNSIIAENIEEEHQLQEDCKELTLHFNQRNLEAILKATRLSLDAIKRRVFFSPSISGGSRLYGSGRTTRKQNNPFFLGQVALEIPNVVMQPSLDDIQHSVHKVTNFVLDVSRNIAQWGQKRFKTASATKEKATDKQHRRSGGVNHAHNSKPTLIAANTLRNYYKSITEHKDILKLIMMLSNAITQTRPIVQDSIEIFTNYQFLWEQDRKESVDSFLKTEPILSEWKAEILHYQDLEYCIDELDPKVRVGCIELTTEPIKMALMIEAKAWKTMFGKSLNHEFLAKMDDIANFVMDYSKRLGRQINDLDDVRDAMAALRDIRMNEIRIDMTLSPIEEAYSLLQKFQVTVPREEIERVDSLRYSFQKLSRQAVKVQTELVRIQPTFKADLLESVEVFVHSVDNFEGDYLINGPMADGIPPQEASDRLHVYQSRFDELWRKFQTYSGGEELFGLQNTDYPFLAKTKKELNLLNKLYGLYNSVIDGINGYYDILWSEVDIEKINGELMDFQNRCRKLPKGLKEWQAFLDLKKKIDDFSESCPLLELMANKAMKNRHWERLTNVTGHVFEIDLDSFSLRNIMEAPILENKEDIEDICISAVKEKDIEAKLSQVVAEWNSQTLSFAPFKTRGELLLKGGETSEIVALMEDSLMVLGSLLSNRYNAPFKKDIQSWVQKLSNSSDIIENWLIVQNLWVYLEAVFVGGDIAKQLPQEAKRFANIDKSWVKIMQRAHENDNVVICCVGDETLGQLLPHLLEQLEICQKSLTGYLEKKRLVFPRFFFISDPALLEILGQASDSHTIQAHLLGIFENVAEVGFHPKDYDRIVSAISREGETIPLEKPVIAKGNVEMWLGELLNNQMSSLHGIIRDGYRVVNDASFDLLNFLNKFIAQVGLLGIQMLWTRDAEEALTLARSDRKIMQAMNVKFLEILNKLIEQTTHELTKVERIKFETLVTIHVHQRDIFNDLVNMHIRNPLDFEWLKQARFYFKEDTDQCIVSITDVDTIYQNEFLGCTDRLVITPLTDRCYITLAQALGMSMGGAPAGPAGTGKTETTKDMGKALGKYVVVFNCSDQMDYRGLGRIYKGLAQSGSWGCFDEFNRIELPVLSVAAQQIAIVLGAKKDRKTEFIFTDGDNVSLNPEFGIFLTMVKGL